MKNADIVMGLLNKLTTDHKNISWSVKCCFTDGTGNSFHQIHLCWRKLKKEKTIFFQMETGKVLINGCQGVNTNEADTIIDVLLDIMNEENPVLK
jgi:hypothetical protein